MNIRPLVRETATRFTRSVRSVLCSLLILGGAQGHANLIVWSSNGVEGLSELTVVRSELQLNGAIARQQRFELPVQTHHVEGWSSPDGRFLLLLNGLAYGPLELTLFGPTGVMGSWNVGDLWPNGDVAQIFPSAVWNASSTAAIIISGTGTDRSLRVLSIQNDQPSIGASIHGYGACWLSQGGFAVLLGSLTESKNLLVKANMAWTVVGSPASPRRVASLETLLATRMRQLGSTILIADTTLGDWKNRLLPIGFFGPDLSYRWEPAFKVANAEVVNHRIETEPWCEGHLFSLRGAELRVRFGAASGLSMYDALNQTFSLLPQGTKHQPNYKYEYPRDGTWRDWSRSRINFNLKSKVLSVEPLSAALLKFLKSNDCIAFGESRAWRQRR